MNNSLDKPVSPPRYQLMARAIEAQMASGELAPGQRLPSFVQMREQFGATQATLDRVYAVLEKKGLIVREAKRGVFVAKPKTRSGRGGASTQTGVIAFDVLEAGRDNPYYLALLSGVQSVLNQSGREVLAASEASVLSRDRVDGVLLCGWMPGAQLRLPPDMPCVSMLYDTPGVQSVVADDAAGAAAAIGHLLNLGHRRIAIISADDVLSVNRIDGYRRCLAGAGIQTEATLMRRLESPKGSTVRSFFQDAGWLTIKRWLHEDASLGGCTALLAQNDETAIGIIQALESAGINVPGRVSVVGFDGTDLAQYFKPRLTTVQVPLYAVGELAAQLLTAQITCSARPRTDPDSTLRVLPMKLCVYESTGSVGSGGFKTTRR